MESGILVIRPWNFSISLMSARAHSRDTYVATVFQEVVMVSPVNREARVWKYLSTLVATVVSSFFPLWFECLSYFHYQLYSLDFFGSKCLCSRWVLKCHHFIWVWPHCTFIFWRNESDLRALRYATRETIFSSNLCVTSILLLLTDSTKF